MHKTFIDSIHYAFIQRDVHSVKVMPQWLWYYIFWECSELGNAGHWVFSIV